jgi:NifU-like protein involved in Fe-S cluster formation
MSSLSYSPLVERYFGHPVSVGPWPKDAAPTAIGDAGHEDLGTRVRFELRSNDGVVTGARFQAFGCPHTIAAAAWLADHLPGRPLESANPMPILDLGRLLDVPTEKLGRLLVVEDALQAAVEHARLIGRMGPESNTEPARGA